LRKNCIFLVDFPQGTVGRHKAPKSKLPMSCTIVVVVVCSVFNGIENRSDEDSCCSWEENSKTCNGKKPHKRKLIKTHARAHARGEYLFFRNANRGYRKNAPSECNNKNTFIKWQLSALGRCSRSPRNSASRRSRSEANTSPPLCL